jgi:DNA transformation protein and related proteins
MDSRRRRAEQRRRQDDRVGEDDVDRGPITTTLPVTESFLAFVLEQLDEVGPITWKRMFGGVGVYAGDLFFALLAGDVLYLKADDSTRGELEAAGGRPFRPYPDREGVMQYYSVPAGILEDGDELVRWAKKSVTVARAQRAKQASSSRKPAARRKGRRRSVN